MRHCDLQYQAALCGGLPPGCDPCKEIHDGDYIRLDGINGTVEILVPAEDK